MTINFNKTLRILAHNVTDTGSLGQAGYFVQSVKINGQDWNKNWFNHNDVMVNGGTIEFFLGDNATEWETGDVPPSPAQLKGDRIKGNPVMAVSSSATRGAVSLSLSSLLFMLLLITI